MVKNAQTLELLERIAAANGVAVNDFLVPQRSDRRDVDLRSGSAYHSATVLTRFFKAFFALPGTENRLRAVRMMEAMAERAHQAR